MDSRFDLCRREVTRVNGEACRPRQGLTILILTSLKVDHMEIGNRLVPRLERAIGNILINCWQYNSIYFKRAYH